METVRKFLEFEFISIGEYTIQVYTLVAILIIFLITKLILWVIKKTIFRKHRFQKLTKEVLTPYFKL